MIVVVANFTDCRLYDPARRSLRATASKDPSNAVTDVNPCLGHATRI